MKSVLLIGLGKFGEILGETLNENGDDVMIVDKDEDVINRLAPKYSGALVANCMNAENLQGLDVPAFDVCVVAMGEDFQASLEITSNLKDLGAKYVISRAVTDIQRKFLFRVGADEVIYPTRDTAEKLAVKINASRVYDYFELDAEYSIFELEVPAKWVGQTLLETNPRGMGINVLSIRKGTTMIPSITADYVFEQGDHMVVFGNTKVIMEFSNKSYKVRRFKKSK